MAEAGNAQMGLQVGLRKNRAAEIAGSLEWLTVALVLALLFRAFVMEAFRIPTGSMANTLKGAHFRLSCPQCGYRYDYGYDSGEQSAPYGRVRSPQTRCPSCGYLWTAGANLPVANGDRILVLKCIYQLFEPKRWDVVVFKNPLEPSVNYIKRLVALPGETVRIIDGDIYIDGRIQRKPPKVQDELWIPVYNHDYRPVRPGENQFDTGQWQSPLRMSGSQWTVDAANPTRICLDCPAGQISEFSYDAVDDSDFRAVYAYNEISERGNGPYCSDLMVRFCVCFANTQATIGIGLSKYGIRYIGSVDAKGRMTIARIADGQESMLTSGAIEPVVSGRPIFISFANVDHKLTLRFGSEQLSYDLGPLPDDAGDRKTDRQPEVKVFGCGKLAATHIGIFRDIHYTTRQYSDRPARGSEKRPFTLDRDEFFVLGDNSPNSEDCRWWRRPGIGNNGRSFRTGIVPGEYLVGKAMFVYWPSGFRLPLPAGVRAFLSSNSDRGRAFRLMNTIASVGYVPDIGQMRLIYGGSGRSD